MWGILAGLVVLLAGGGLFFIFAAFREMKPQRASERERGTSKSAYLDLQFGKHVRQGRLYLADKPRGLVILLHNWGASRHRYYPIGDALAQAGFQVFLYDLPGHGVNWGRTPLWIIGAKPRMIRDLRNLIADLRARPDCAGLPVSLFGFSMGSGVALEVFKDDPTLPALICDSGPFSLVPYVCILLVRRIIPERPAWYQQLINYAFCFLVNLPWPRLVLDGLSRVEGRKLLLIENERETLIPVREVHDLRDQWPGPKTYWLVERAQHLMAHNLDFADYIRRVVAFLQEDRNPR